MKHPRLSLVGAAAAAVVRTPQEPMLPDREPVIRKAIEQLVKDEAPFLVDRVPYDFLRAVWQFGYEQRDADGRQFMGQVGVMMARLKPVIDACAVQMEASPPTLTPDVPEAWRGDFDALRVFLEARDRKCDDGDALQGCAEAEAALTARLGLSSGLDRLEAALVARRDRQKDDGDFGSATATASALKLLRGLK